MMEQGGDPWDGIKDKKEAVGQLSGKQSRPKEAKGEQHPHHSGGVSEMLEREHHIIM